jgi:hypothetical protein
VIPLGTLMRIGSMGPSDGLVERRMLKWIRDMQAA